MFKNIFRKSQLISPEEQIAQWEKAGKPSPPPHIIKQKAIEEFQNKFQTDTLIETGTYLGDMVEAQRNYFKQIFSIELSKKLFDRANKRFKSFPQIKILQGDSGQVLHNLIPALNKPALFWLDGHYSRGITAKGDKECPVINELKAIFTSPHNHIILIDDARLFNGMNDYPAIEEISEIIKEKGRNYSVIVQDDIIRLIPNFKEYV